MYADLYFDVKNNFYEIFFTCLTDTGHKSDNVWDSLKFGTFDISNILLLILMSKISFI